MEWLKDKKNLPIVVALGVVVLLVAGGLIALELGAFNGSSTVATTPATTTAAGYPGAGASAYPGGYPGGYPGAGAGGYPGGSLTPAVAATAPAARPGAATAAVSPMAAADPFALSGAHKALPAASVQKIAIAMRPSLRDAIPPLNLFSLRPPSPQVSTAMNLPNGGDQSLAGTRVSGIVTAADGIFAVVDVNGVSQTVKPGDSLAGGSKVASIQSTGVTLHTPEGNTITVPLSNGPPEQNQPGGFGGGYPGGFGGGGYPGGGGGGYPGGFGGGGGYPGGGGGGYPGGGGFGGGDMSQ